MRRSFLPGIALAFVLFIMIFVSSNVNWGKDHWRQIILADAKGYYAYLPAVFIYHDLNFGFFDRIEKGKYYEEFLFYDYRAQANGKTISKYYCGTAVACSPFFLAAHGLTRFTGHSPDGYSAIYPVFINLAAIFYLLAGLFFLNKTMSLYSAGAGTRAMVVVAAVFGTNLFYYSFREPGMSHVYSFAYISLFVWTVKRWFVSADRRALILAGLALGMICLIRPVNGLVVLAIPFIAGSYASLSQGLTSVARHPVQATAGILGFLALVSVQAILYRISTGSFWVWSYTGEGFNFGDPHITDILFSYRKGLFLYTPLYLISMAGLIPLWRKSRFAAVAWLLFFSILTYVFSSWWNWYYGGSFSSRVYVEFLPFFMILLAIAIHEVRGKILRTGLLATVILLLLLCQVQTYQYRYYQIHWSDMNREKYWDAFLRIDRLITPSTSPHSK